MKRFAALHRFGCIQEVLTQGYLVFMLLLAAVCFTAVSTFPAYAEDDNAVDEHQIPDSSFIYDTSIAALSGADSYYDNQTVQITGEAIGDNIAVTLDAGHRWITLTSLSNPGPTVTVYMAAESAAHVDTFGAYGKTGTTLQVRGTFHLACPEHDGLTDLHADYVSVVKKGSEHPDEFNFEGFIPGIVCLAVGLVLTLAFYRLRERLR